jgi:hypothetical protein
MLHPFRNGSKRVATDHAPATSTASAYPQLAAHNPARQRFGRCVPTMEIPPPADEQSRSARRRYKVDDRSS